MTVATGTGARLLTGAIPFAFAAGELDSVARPAERRRRGPESEPMVRQPVFVSTPITTEEEDAERWDGMS